MNKRILHWSYSNMHEIPIDLFLYENLEEVYLKENYITTIPKWFVTMSTLKFINLSGNNITELPEEILLLKNLEYFDVSYNQLRKIPETLCYLEKLERLNLGSNRLTELPCNIDGLKSLQFLDVSENQLSRLPIQLCECPRLQTLIVNNNIKIWYIPERIAYMKSIQMFAADCCSVAYLPISLPKFVTYLRLFDNPGIGHIPMSYIKFYRGYYGYQNRSAHIAITNKNLFWVLEKETNTKLLLPVGTRKIFSMHSKDNQVTLYDHCLKALEKLNNRSPPLYRDPSLYFIMPETYMYHNIRNGPLGYCTSDECPNPLYTSYYFMVVKRVGSSSSQLFTSYFCTAFCAKQWFTKKSKKYYYVDWEVEMEECDHDGYKKSDDYNNQFEHDD